MLNPLKLLASQDVSLGLRSQVVAPGSGALSTDLQQGLRIGLFLLMTLTTPVPWAASQEATPDEDAKGLRTECRKYQAKGELQPALKACMQALATFRGSLDRSGEAATLNILAMLYRDLGDRQKALEYYQQVLVVRRETGDRRNEAAALNNIGKVHAALGDKQKAMEYFEQALSLAREIADRNAEASILNSMGKHYGDLGAKQKALDYY